MRGVSIREVHRLLGHMNLESTMVYLHVIRNLQHIPVSPLDVLTQERSASLMHHRNTN